MGLFDKIAQQYQQELPDYAAEISNDLAHESVLATSRVVAAAFTRGGHGAGLEGGILSRILSGLLNASATAKHLGGEPGSIARQLELSDTIRVLCLGDTHLSWWDFGAIGDELPGTLMARVARTSVASIDHTGKRALGGGELIRITFVDDSFADFQAIRPSSEFRVAADLYGSQDHVMRAPASDAPPVPGIPPVPEG